MLKMWRPKERNYQPVRAQHISAQSGSGSLNLAREEHGDKSLYSHLYSGNTQVIPLRLNRMRVNNTTKPHTFITGREILKVLCVPSTFSDRFHCGFNSLWGLLVKCEFNSVSTYKSIPFVRNYANPLSIFWRFNCFGAHCISVHFIALTFHWYFKLGPNSHRVSRLVEVTRHVLLGHCPCHQAGNRECFSGAEDWIST